MNNWIWIFRGYSNNCPFAYRDWLEFTFIYIVSFFATLMSSIAFECLVLVDSMSIAMANRIFLFDFSFAALISGVIAWVQTD